MIGPLQSHYHEGSPVGKRHLRWEGFVEKVGFESGVKEWWMMRVGMMIEMSWQVNEDVSRDMTGEGGGMIQGVDSRDFRWCISEWAICDFQWGDGWWARKGDNRWGAGTARGLNIDQIVKIARLTGCENFVGKRKKFIYNAFIDICAVCRTHPVGRISQPNLYCGSCVTTARGSSPYLCWRQHASSCKFWSLWLLPLTYFGFVSLTFVSCVMD